MTVITTDQDDTVFTTKNGERLEVRPGVMIDPGDSNIALESDFANCVLINSGQVQAYDGVVLTGEHNRLVNKSHGTIHAVQNGVMVTGDQATVNNQGDINAQYGVRTDGLTALNLLNEGTITGSTAAILIVNLDDPNGPHTIDVHNSGLIDAFDFAISMDDDAAQLTVTNDGTLRGGIGAIRGEMSSAMVVNHSQIDGDVSLGEATASSTVLNSGAIDGDVVMSQHASDHYDGANGSLTGTVYGGVGDDTLMGGSGTDRLEGDGGVDILQSVAGAADVYVYAFARDSVARAHDMILTWQSVDQLDLTHVDADKMTTYLQHATFGGEVASAADAIQGEVVYYHDGGDTYVVLDHNGVGAGSNLVIEIAGEVTLTADNFVL